MLDLSIISNNISSIIVPGLCKSLHELGARIDVSFANEVKIIIDLNDVELTHGNISILEQKIEGMMMARFSDLIYKIGICGGRVSGAPIKQINKDRSVNLKGMFVGIDGVKNIIAIASGKGGVGKSTVTANLALSMASMGYKIGIVDADIYGSSIPALFSCTENDKPRIEDGKIVPVEKRGIKMISIGFLVEKDSPIIWRGPLLTKALNQMFRSVNWGEIDYLLVDTPPGTGDVHISMIQNFPVTTSILVSIDHKLSIANTLKTKSIFASFGISDLGCIFNMSYAIKDNSEFNVIKSIGNLTDFADLKSYKIMDEVATMVIKSCPIHE